MTDDEIIAHYARLGKPIPKTLFADYRPGPMFTAKERQALAVLLVSGPPYRDIAIAALAAESPATDTKN